MSVATPTQKPRFYRDEPGVKLRDRRSNRPMVRGWGRFRLKWRFPLFLHPSPLYSSEWVMHCDYHICEPAPLRAHHTAVQRSAFGSLTLRLSDGEPSPALCNRQPLGVGGGGVWRQQVLLIVITQRGLHLNFIRFFRRRPVVWRGCRLYWITGCTDLPSASAR